MSLQTPVLLMAGLLHGFPMQPLSSTHEVPFQEAPGTQPQVYLVLGARSSIHVPLDNNIALWAHGSPSQPLMSWHPTVSLMYCRPSVHWHL